MTFKRPIYRLMFFAAWIVVLGGIVTLFIAANKKNKEHLCKGVDISINNGGSILFVGKEDVMKSLEKTSNGSLIKKQFAQINLNALEKGLRMNPWIRYAELYFDTKDVLHVSVTERVPAARVFTTTGTSFYMDTAGSQMPLVEKYSTRLPVVTGFTAAKRFTSKDSAFLQQLKTLVRTIVVDSFWNAQIGQIDITPARTFELVPLIGTGIIRLGDASNLDNKLNRLLLFYKQVLLKTGFAKYTAIDVQFDGQIIGVKRGAEWVIDSIQLQKNIQELMRKKAAEQEAEGIEPEENMQTHKYPSIELYKDSLQQKPEAITIENLPANNPEHPSNIVKPAIKKPDDKPKKINKPVQKPKAVMPSG